MATISGGSVVWDLDINKGKLTRGLAEARSDVNGAAKDMEGSFSGAAGVISKSMSLAITGVLALGTAAVGVAGFGIKIAADIETARQGFTTLLGSVDAANEAIAMIKRDAATTPFEFSGLVRANQLLTQVTKNAPQSERLLLNVGRALSAAGKSGTELDNVIVNLQQIANTSKISELDIRQFGFAGINILELLADYYGVTKEAAGDMVKNSKDAFADLEGAFAKAGEGGGKFSRAFIDQAGTFNQLMSNFKDVTSQIAADIVTQTGIFDAAKSSLGGLVSTLQSLQPDIISGVSSAMKTLSDAATLLGDAFNTHIKPSLDRLIGVVNSELMPSLQRLWTLVGPVLGPVLEFLGKVVGTIVIAALQAFIEVLIYVVQYISNVADNISNLIVMFQELPGKISSALSGIKDAIVRPFQEAFDTVKGIFDDIKGKMDQISPFHRNSPSLVDKVTSGVDIIKDQFASLKNMSFPRISDSIPAMSDPTSSEGSRVSSFEPTSSRGVAVTVNVGQINHPMDVESTSRELGYRASLLPAT